MSDARSTYEHDKMCDATVKVWTRRADGSLECLECRHLQAIRADERECVEERVGALFTDLRASTSVNNRRVWDSIVHAVRGES